MATMFNGDQASFNELIYGRPHEECQEFIQEQQQQFMSNVIPSAQSFFHKAWEFEARIMNSNVVRRATGAARKIKSLWQTDEIRELCEIGEIQNAPNCMHRFIMAQPDARKMWRAGLISGYNDSVSRDKDLDEEDLLEWRQVMSGEEHMTPDDPDCDYEFITYQDDYLDEFPELKITEEEKYDIRSTWDRVRHLLCFTDDDPTSPTNEEQEEHE